jgi:hypothetical protein
MAFLHENSPSASEFGRVRTRNRNWQANKTKSCSRAGPRSSSRDPCARRRRLDHNVNAFRGETAGCFTHSSYDIRSPHAQKTPPLKTLEIDEECLIISCSLEQPA